MSQKLVSRVESKKGGKPGYVDKRDVERWQER